LNPRADCCGADSGCCLEKQENCAGGESIVPAAQTCLGLGMHNTPPSPCTGICRIDPVSQLCEGCKRRLGEIADWPMLTPAQKRAILADLRERG
jgi:hypothetical protein